MNSNNPDVLLSIVIPCLNEEQTLLLCVQKALNFIQKNSLQGEVVVADNGSTDRSVLIATEAGARVVHESAKGYGNALKKGIEESTGRFVIMGDADDSYDFNDLQGFLDKLNSGYDLVMGTRLNGRIEPGAMSWSHYLGNLALTGILNILYRAKVSDAYCGLRGFTRNAYQKMNLKHNGMEFACEMVVKASKHKLSITEIPIVYYKDKRNRPSHLKTFRDGWRTLRFLMIYSPTLLYLIPGLSLCIVGFFILARGLFNPIQLSHFTLDYHFNFLGSIFAIIGFQLIMLGLYARSFAYIKGFDRRDNFIKKFVQSFSLERGLLLGIACIGLGAVFAVTMLIKWISSGFGPLFEVRKGIIAVTLLAIGFQYISSCFLMSLLLMEHQDKPKE